LSSFIFKFTTKVFIVFVSEKNTFCSLKDAFSTVSQLADVVTVFEIKASLCGTQLKPSSQGYNSVFPLKLLSLHFKV
jgi:hypothetical protein